MYSHYLSKQSLDEMESLGYVMSQAFFDYFEFHSEQRKKTA